MKIRSEYFGVLLTAMLLSSLSAQTSSSSISAGTRNDDPKWSKYLIPENGTSLPIATDAPAVQYSKEAETNKIEGTVVLMIGINAKGKVEIAEVVKGLGYGLDEKALDTVKKWQFQPALQEGKPIAMVAKVDVSFHFYHPDPPPDLSKYQKTAKDGASPPRPLYAPAPEYPLTVQMQIPKSGGVVIVGAGIGTDGSVEVVFIAKSQGPIMDKIALETVKKWRFTPAMKDGNPVPVRINVEVSFHSH